MESEVTGLEAAASSGKLRRGHHKVPKFYLRRFADEAGRITSFDFEARRWFPQTIETAAVEKDFYAIETLDGPSDAAEHSLAWIEGAIAPGMAKWNGATWPPDEDMRSAMVNFVALQLTRGARWREVMRQGLETETFHDLSLIADDFGSFRWKIEQLAHKRFRTADVRSLQAAIQRGEFPVELSSGRLVTEMFKSGSDLVEDLARMTLQLVESAEDHFLTADEPVWVELTPMLDLPGPNVPTSLEITMPLDPTRGVVFRTPSRRGEVRRRVGKSTVTQWNRRLTRIAHRYLYAHPSSVELPTPIGRFDELARSLDPSQGRSRTTETYQSSKP